MASVWTDFIVALLKKIDLYFETSVQRVELDGRRGIGRGFLFWFLRRGENRTCLSVEKKV